MDILVRIFGWTITIAISLFVIVSIVLFIKDGIVAKYLMNTRLYVFCP